MASAVVAATRPEGMLVAACMGTGVLALRGLAGRWRDGPIVLGTILIGAAAVVALRLAIGLRVFPNPVYAKQDIAGAERLYSGVAYFGKFFREFPALSILGFAAFCVLVLAVTRSIRARRRWTP